MLQFSAVRRQEPLGWGSCLVFLAALALAFTVSGLLLAVQDEPAERALWLVVHSAFSSGYALED